MTFRVGDLSLYLIDAANNAHAVDDGGCLTISLPVGEYVISTAQHSASRATISSPYCIDSDSAQLTAHILPHDTPLICALAVATARPMGMSARQDA